MHDDVIEYLTKHKETLNQMIHQNPLIVKKPTWDLLMMVYNELKHDDIHELTHLLIKEIVYYINKIPSKEIIYSIDKQYLLRLHQMDWLNIINAEMYSVRTTRILISIIEIVLSDNTYVIEQLLSLFQKNLKELDVEETINVIYELSKTKLSHMCYDDVFTFLHSDPSWTSLKNLSRIIKSHNEELIQFVLMNYKDIRNKCWKDIILETGNVLGIDLLIDGFNTPTNPIIKNLIKKDKQFINNINKTIDTKIRLLF